MRVIFISWLGKMARNSHSIARHFNVAMESIGRAVRPKSQSLWVYLDRDNAIAIYDVELPLKSGIQPLSTDLS